MASSTTTRLDMSDRKETKLVWCELENEHPRVALGTLLESADKDFVVFRLLDGREIEIARKCVIKIERPAGE